MQFRFSIRKGFKGMILGIRKDADGPKTLKQFHVEADFLALPRLSRTAEGDCRRIWVTDDHRDPLSFGGDRCLMHER